MREFKRNKQVMRKAYLNNELKNVILSKDVYETVSGNPLKIFVGTPYNKKLYKLNNIYLRSVLILEPNTNILLAAKGSPANDDYLMMFYELNRQSYFKYMRRMIIDGILLKVEYYDSEFYIMNPFFVVCGETISEYCVNMFEDHSGYIIGRKLYNELFKDVMTIEKAKEKVLLNGKKI
jgi:hypothetical protein